MKETVEIKGFAITTKTAEQSMKFIDELTALCEKYAIRKIKQTVGHPIEYEFHFGWEVL